MSEKKSRRLRFGEAILRKGLHLGMVTSCCSKYLMYVQPNVDLVQGKEVIQRAPPQAAVLELGDE